MNFKKTFFGRSRIGAWLVGALLPTICILPTESNAKTVSGVFPPRKHNANPGVPGAEACVVEVQKIEGLGRTVLRDYAIQTGKKADILSIAQTVANWGQKVADACNKNPEAAQNYLRMNGLDEKQPMRDCYAFCYFTNQGKDYKSCADNCKTYYPECENVVQRIGQKFSNPNARRNWGNSLRPMCARNPKGKFEQLKYLEDKSKTEPCWMDCYTKYRAIEFFVDPKDKEKLFTPQVIAAYNRCKAACAKKTNDKEPLKRF